MFFRYLTGFGVFGGFVLIYEFYFREVVNVVYLIVDITFRNGEVIIKVFIFVNLFFGD